MGPKVPKVALSVLCAVALTTPASHAAPKETPPKKVVALVFPFEADGDLPDWAAFALAEATTDLLAQGDTAWVSLKQLDSVLRRRDLEFSQVASAVQALPLARTLGASDAVVGSLKFAGGRWSMKAQRFTVLSREPVRSSQGEAAEADLPQLAAKLALDLFSVAPRQGLMSKDTNSLSLTTQCTLALIHQPLRPVRGRVLPLEKPAEIEELCNKAVAAAGPVSEGKAGLSIVHTLAGDPPRGRAEAVSAHKDRFVPLAYLADAFAARQTGDQIGSRRVLNDAISLKPGFLHALVYLAEDRDDAEDWKTALKDWERVLDKTPFSPFALAHKGHALARLGRMRDALAVTRQAIALDPENPEIQIELASRLIDANQDKEAEEILRGTLEARPPRPLAWLRLGFIYLRQKKAKDARDVLTEAAGYAYREDEAYTRGLAFADLARVNGLEGHYKKAVENLAAAKKEGQPRVLPCDAEELKKYKGKPEFDAVCAK